MYLQFIKRIPSASVYTICRSVDIAHMFHLTSRTGLQRSNKLAPSVLVKEYGVFFSYGLVSVCSVRWIGFVTSIHSACFTMCEIKTMLPDSCSKVSDIIGDGCDTDSLISNYATR